jgi:molybdopterin-synthase adenylyltransferase
MVNQNANWQVADIILKASPYSPPHSTRTLISSNAQVVGRLNLIQSPQRLAITMAERTPDSSREEEIPSRYLRQQRFAPIGPAGQDRLQNSAVLICGCGALGSVIAERLARAGVGKIRIVDRDWVELTNLQRQTLFIERHAQAATPKAIAAAEMLSQINSSIEVVPFVEDLTCDNIATLATGCDLLLDGTDNFETRFIINDYCIKFGVPWIHAGCLGASGQVLTILPGKTACFRCLVPELPPPDAMQTCDTAGVLGPAIGIIASWQAAEALKLLSGNSAIANKKLLVLDTWDTDCRLVNLQPFEQCPTCAQRKFEFLDGRIRSESVVLCGKNAVQITPPTSIETLGDLVSLAEKWRAQGPVNANAFFVRLRLAKHQITVFRGGRAVIEGTISPTEAKSILARVLGG